MIKECETNPMGDFFRGWRRKVGCVSLVLVCAVTCVWMRSLAVAAIGTVAITALGSTYSAGLGLVGITLDYQIQT